MASSSSCQALPSPFPGPHNTDTMEGTSLSSHRPWCPRAVRVTTPEMSVLLGPDEGSQTDFISVSGLSNC